MRERIAYLLPIFLFQWLVSDFAYAEAPASKVSAILSQIESGLPDIQNEPEDVRQEVIWQTASLNALLGNVNAALQADIKNPDHREQVLSQAAVQEAKSGRLEQAAKKVFQIKNPLYIFDAFIGIALSLPKEDSYAVQEYFKKASDQIAFLLEKDRLEQQEGLAFAEFKAGYLTKALEVIAGIPDDSFKAAAIRDILNKTKEAAQFKQLESAITLTPDKLVRDPLLEQSIFSQARAGFLKEALQLADKLQGAPRVRALSQIAFMHGQAKDMSSATKLFAQAKKILNQIKPDEDKAQAYGSLAMAQTWVGLTKQAADNFQKMKVIALQMKKDSANRVSLLIQIAQGQFINGQLEEAYTSYHMAADALAQAEMDEASKIRSYSSIGKGLVLLKRDSEGKEFFVKSKNRVEGLQSIDDKILALIAIAMDETEAKMDAEVSQTLDLVIGLIIKNFDEEARLAYLEQIGRACVQSGQLQKAAGLPDLLSSPPKQGDLLQLITFELAKKGADEEAVKIAKSRSKSHRLRGLLGAAFGVLSREAEC